MPVCGRVSELTAVAALVIANAFFVLPEFALVSVRRICGSKNGAQAAGRRRKVQHWPTARQHQTLLISATHSA